MAKSGKRESSEPAPPKALVFTAPSPAGDESIEAQRLNAILALRPHVGETLRDDETARERLLFLLALTAEEPQAKKYAEAREKEAELRGKAESKAIVEEEIRRQLNKETGVLTEEDLASITGLDFTFTDLSDLTPLAGLTSLRSLDLTITQVSDLSPLAKLTQLVHLGLTGTKVTDVTPLARLTSLEKLDLCGTEVSGVAPLAGLTGLQMLSLSLTQVCDLSPLAKLTQLKQLDLRETKVTDVTPLEHIKGLEIIGP